MAGSNKTILMRAYVVYVIILLLGLMIIFRIVQIQFVEGSHWKSMEKLNKPRVEVLEPITGNIFAEDNNLLVTSLPIYDIAMDLDSSVISEKEFAREIKVLGYYFSYFFHKNIYYHNLYKSNLIRERKKGNRNFIIIKNATFNQLKIIKKFPLLKKGSAGGLKVTKKFKRIKPLKNLAASTTGFVRLTQYSVIINLNNKKIPLDEFNSKLDTLTECFYNLFKDFPRRKYKQQLLDSYTGNDKNNPFKKDLDEIQLKELKTFPLICKDTAGIIKIKNRLRPYYVGIEGYYRVKLRGEKGYEIKRNVGNNNWRKLNDDDIINPVDGSDLYTSIDVFLQDVADNALRKCLDSNNAKWGCAILMEVQTGYIKAMANLHRDDQGVYKEVRNYAAEELIEPGSTLKLASVVAALEAGKLDTSYPVQTGTRNIPGWGIIYDSHEDGYGTVSAAKAFLYSSNSGISDYVYYSFNGNFNRFRDVFEKMNLMSKSGIDIENEPDPQLKNFTTGNLRGIAYGYSIKYTPLQILAFYNAIANNGKYMKPMLVKEIREKNKMPVKMEPVVVKDNICSESTLKKVKRLLESVVEKGTAKNISNSAYKVAGKTGTAKLYDPVSQQYIRNYIASFAGYFPANDPKFSCIVVVYNPAGTEYYGSQIAAPVFKEIADKVYATRVDIKSKDKKMPEVLSVPQVYMAHHSEVIKIYNELNLSLLSTGNISEWVSVSLENGRLKLIGKPMPQQHIMPDLSGMSARDAVFLLTGMGIQVQVFGMGRVVSQSVMPGENLKKVKQVNLYLSLRN